MFRDTSGLLCFLDRADHRHRHAVQLVGLAPSRLTHNCVLAEFAALSHSRRMPRSLSLQFVRVLEQHHAVEVAFIDKPLHDDALDLLERRLDKDWSLCDAVSFVLMDSRGIREALTTDHHFEQAGFLRLLKP